MKYISKSGYYMAIVLMLLAAGCLNDKEEECKWNDCTQESCPRCPAGIVHGYYDYEFCSCQCEVGWAGTLCDQRDTSLYIRFRHGVDTTALSDWLITHNYYADSLSVDFEGYFDSGSAIDTIRLWRIPLAINGFPVTKTVCANDSCAFLELIFDNTSLASPVSGFVRLDSVELSLFSSVPIVLKGTFEAKFSVSGGGEYFLRDGTFRLPLFQSTP